MRVKATIVMRRTSVMHNFGSRGPVTTARSLISIIYNNATGIDGPDIFKIARGRDKILRRNFMWHVKLDADEYGFAFAKMSFIARRRG